MLLALCIAGTLALCAGSAWLGYLYGWAKCAEAEKEWAAPQEFWPKQAANMFDDSGLDIQQ